MSPTFPGSAIQLIPIDEISPNPFSLEIYGQTSGEIDDLIDSVRTHGILVPLVVVVVADRTGWELISGHRRLESARTLEMRNVPCEVRFIPDHTERRRAILEYNRQRRKTFTQLMREADALETILGQEAIERRNANLRQNQTDRRNPDNRQGRTDDQVARAIGLGGKDIYRQARAIWAMALTGDARARSGVGQLDVGTKTVHAAYKDLRRRDQFRETFRPTPYDVWAFRHDRAFGIPHPGSIPPGIVAHALHYYTQPGDLVVDPTAGGGTTLDVCQAMDRLCLAYDLDPVRPEIRAHDIRHGFPSEAKGATLIFCDPPYHTMLAHHYKSGGLAHGDLNDWSRFLEELGRNAMETLRPGGYIALLLANQTEKDIPAGQGYIDHVFMGYNSLKNAGFLPERRISCPMDGAYLPQHVRRAREQVRMLGQVRDLVVMRKPEQPTQSSGSPPASS